MKTVSGGAWVISANPAGLPEKIQFIGMRSRGMPVVHRCRRKPAERIDPAGMPHFSS